MFFILSLTAVITVIFTPSPQAAGASRLLVLPFTIHSEKDLTFLQNGIRDMLSTRLASEGKVVPVDTEETRQILKKLSGPIDRQAAVELGKRLDADYVIFGSLTFFGESISTDARFIDIRQNKPLIVFSQSGKSHDDVISHIDLFSARINEEVFGRTTHTTYVPSPQPRPEASADHREHPEKLLAGDNEIEITDSVPRTISPQNTFKIWKSRKFNTQIKGMSIGDVDEDGRNETVFISDGNVFIYRQMNGKFEKIGEVKEDTYNTIIGVDVADINKNGKSEIFVTSLHKKTRRLKSFVLEWDGSGFTKISKDLNWFFRVLNTPDRGDILLGQKRGTDRYLFFGNVFEMKWESGIYAPSERQILPKGINIYGFAYGDVLNNGKEMIVAFTKKDRIRILARNGEEEWTGADPYGGSSTYLEYPSETDTKKMEHYYLKQRLYITDLDKDGKNDVIAVKNDEFAGRLFQRFRRYKSGHIELLTWDNIGLQTKWKTSKISGYISDYTIGDHDNDGQDELVFSVVAKGAGITGKGKSFIVSQELFE